MESNLNAEAAKEKNDEYKVSNIIRRTINCQFFQVIQTFTFSVIK